MCTKQQAIKILSQVNAEGHAIFGGVQDAYLYGSYARGDYTAESDIDILLTVNMDAASIARHRNTVAAMTSRLSLENDITVSVTVKPAAQFHQYAQILPYYCNILKEGIRCAG